MIQKYEILVTEKGVDETAKKFENLGNQAAIANQKAAGFFGMANAPTATAFKQAFADVQRYGRALQNIKAPGKEPYALISRELESMTGYAQQYHSMLTKVTGETRKATSAAGQFQKATYPPSAITPGVTGFTPIKESAAFKQSMAESRYFAAQMSESYDKLEGNSRNRIRDLKEEAIIAAANERLHQRVAQEREARSQKASDTAAKELNTRKAITGVVRDEVGVKSELDRVTERFGKKIEQQSAAEVDGINQAHAANLKKSKAQSSANNKSDDEFKKMVATRKQGIMAQDAAMKELGKTGGFINSKFATFSIIMSGIAATLFVWQTVSRVIANIVSIGTNMEVAYARVADKLKLSADEMARLNEEGRKQAKQGGPPVQDYVALVAEFEKWGATHEAAIEYVNAALEKERALLQGTVTQELKEFKGLWSEIAKQSFEASKSSLIDFLESVNKQLKNVTDAEGGINKLVSALGALRAASEGLSANNKIQEIVSQPLTKDSDLGGLIWGLAKSVAQSGLGMRFGMKPKPIPPPIPAGAGTIMDPKIKENTTELEALAQSIGKEFTVWNSELGKIDTATWGAVLNAEEMDQQAKNMSRDMKIASDILGEMNAKQLENQTRNIELMMKNIALVIPDVNKQMHVARVMVANQRQANIQPQVDVWQSFYREVGIMDERLYTERKKRIDELYDAQMTAQGDVDPQGLAAAARNEALFKLDQDYYKNKFTAAQSFYELFGSMQDEYITYRQAQIDNMYEHDLKALGSTRAEMLKTEREYILEQQKLQTPMAFYKKYYDEFGIMSDEYYKNEQKKINHEYEANKEVNKDYAERMRTRQKFVLDSKKLFSEAFTKKFGGKEGQGGITVEGIQNMERLAESTGYVSEKLKEYWEIRNQLVEKTIAGTTGDPEAGRLAKMKEEYDQEVLTKSKLVGIWEDYYQKTGIMSEGYYNYQIWSIKEIEKMDALATGNAVAAHAVMLEKKKQLDREYELSKMGGGFYKEAEQWDIQAPQAYYDKLAEMDREQAEDYIEAGADRLAVEEWLHKKLLALRAEQLSKSKESIDGFELQAIRVELATKTAAERTAETINRLVEGTKDVFSDQIFGLFQGEFDGLFNLFEDLAGNWKKMIDRMVSDWLAAGIAKMLFGDLAGGTGLGGGTGSTGGFGWLGQVGTWIGLGLGVLGGGTTQTGMTSQSINPYLQLVKAKGGVFTTIGELHRFASGGIFNRETQFAYAGGMGVLGESGPEAIVPLKRGKDGKLGIASFGEGQNVTISPTIIVQAPEGRLPRDSMNQLTSRLGQTIYGSMRKNG